MILGYDALQGSVLDSCSPLRHGGMDVWALTFKHRCHEEFRKESDLPDSKLSLHFLFQRDEGLSLQGMRAHISSWPHVPLHMTARWHGEVLASCTHASGPFPPGNGDVLAQEAAVIPRKKRDQKHCLGLDPKVLTLHSGPGGSSKSPLDSIKDHLMDRHPFVVVEPGSLGSGCC